MKHIDCRVAGRVISVKQFVASFLLSGFLTINGWAAELLTSDQFTEKYRLVVLSIRGVSGATVRGPLQVQVSFPDDQAWVMNLDNAYLQYQQNPETLEATLKQYSEGALKLRVTTPNSQFKLFPVIKPKDFDKRLSEASKTYGEFAQSPFVGELSVFYVYDEEASVRFAKFEDVKNYASSNSELLQLAVANLRRDRPSVKLNQIGPLVLVTEAGAYGASLLLLDEFWDKFPIKFKGDIVVYPIARDYFAITGSGELDGIKAANASAAQQLLEAAYGISDKPIVRKNGKWEVFKQ